MHQTKYHTLNVNTPDAGAWDTKTEVEALPVTLLIIVP
jgi:hypothetical protein